MRPHRDDFVSSTLPVTVVQIRVVQVSVGHGLVDVLVGVNRKDSPPREDRTTSNAIVQVR